MLYDFLQKHLMVVIKGLCKASSSLGKSDVVTFVALLKAAKLPPGIKAGDTGKDVLSAELLFVRHA